MAIEDSPTGVASALAAGAAVLAVPPERASSPPADGVHLRDTLTGVDLDLLRRTLLGPAPSMLGA